MTAALRILAYGVTVDLVDKYVRIGESTIIECMKRFCKGIVHIDGEEYLRSLNATDISRLLRKGDQRSFPGILGSLDCMHWSEKIVQQHIMDYTEDISIDPQSCLKSLHRTICGYGIHFFGMPGSNNNINILDVSDLFTNLNEGCGSPANFSINGKQYNMSYYPANGIYPHWATIVQTISQPQGELNKFFVKKQESYRKEVERAFGVLQARFAIIRGPSRLWHHEDSCSVMKACIILHNMIIENEHDDGNAVFIAKHALDEYESIDTNNHVEVSQNRNLRFNEYIVRHLAIRCEQT